MPRRVFDFDPPDRFIADAVGEPGRRTFFLQASRGSLVVSVALEKVQVAVLAERLATLLAELRRSGEEVPETAAASEDRSPLQEPVREEFRVGTLTMAWDASRRRVILEARAVTDETAEEVVESVAEDDDDDPDRPDLVRVRISPAEALAFVERASRVLAAGRPPCPLCGAPLNPEGHLCPRRNGYVH